LNCSGSCLIIFSGDSIDEQVDDYDSHDADDVDGDLPDSIEPTVQMPTNMFSTRICYNF
jgi:hypothetical protein